jgi:diketogulonate reductase-like aldo/keto reductase
MLSSRTVQGVPVPSFLYGTAWKEERTEALTRLALGAGFRAIDTANQRRHYVEAAVGAALAAAMDDGIRRQDLFVQAKFTHVRGHDERIPYDPKADIPAQVEQSFASSLEHLRLTHVDSYILHGPAMPDGLVEADWAAWRAMAALRRAGKAHLLGISNVTVGQLGALLRGGERPAFVQNRCYARTGWDREVRALCRAHGVVYQAFSLLTANRRELASPVVTAIAERTGRSEAQLVFRFATQLGMLPITGTSDPEHMTEDLDLDDFVLSEEEVHAIEHVDR